MKKFLTVLLLLSTITSCLLNTAEAGSKSFCKNPQNGFSIGKDNQPYPYECDPTVNFLFKNEYDRGHLIAENIKSIQTTIDTIDENINSIVRTSNLEHLSSGFYAQDKYFPTPGGEQGANTANYLIQQKQELQAKLKNLRMQT